MVDAYDDVPSPRTLRAAAERLAQYTSEGDERSSGAPVDSAFLDLYSEVSQNMRRKCSSYQTAVLLGSGPSNIFWLIKLSWQIHMFWCATGECS